MKMSNAKEKIYCHIDEYLVSFCLTHYHNYDWLPYHKNFWLWDEHIPRKDIISGAVTAFSNTILFSLFWNEMRLTEA